MEAFFGEWFYGGRLYAGRKPGNPPVGATQHCRDYQVTQPLPFVVSLDPFARKVSCSNYGGLRLLPLQIGSPVGQLRRCVDCSSVIL